MRRFQTFLPAVALFFVALSCGKGPAAPGDPTIAAAVAEVSIDSVRVYIDELVALHTRHTLSAQSDPGRGIGAAVDYLARRCEEWAGNVPAVIPECRPWPDNGWEASTVFARIRIFAVIN